ncbi:MAG: acyl-CoA desaturase [Betaproteobacteria bacterium]|nr:acyl-CoA desaturase [Betaproteobacteria bacterium]
MTNYGIQKTESIKVIKMRLVVVHLGALAALLVPFHWHLLVLFAASYLPRMFGVEAGYHRYFSHRAFKTSRWFQFVLAVLGASSGQRGALWWAAHHRTHHKHADTERDLHSPLGGFWHSHWGWLMQEKNVDTNLDLVPDFARYPELRFINKYYHLPLFALLVLLAVAGARGWLGPHIDAWQAVTWGFFLPTAAALHAILGVNSLAHGGHRLAGYRRYDTRDLTVNHVWLALPSMGGAWHNNHHRFGAGARAGFAWYEVDLSYVGLRMLAALGLVWDLRQVPDAVLREGGLLPREKQQGSLAG